VAVVVAAHEKQGDIEHGNQESEVFRWQIAAGEDQVDVRKIASLKLVEKHWFDAVRHGQYFHQAGFHHITDADHSLYREQPASAEYDSS
jgi:hypothetical protein